MEIKAGGNVGIGTNASQNLLHQHVGTNSNNYHQFTTSRSGQANGSAGFRIGITDANSQAQAEIRQGETSPMNFLTSGSPRMQIYDASGSPSNAGYVALGDYSTFSPQAMLHQHLNSTGNTYHVFTTSRSGATATTDGFKIGITDRSSTPEVDINQQENAAMRLYTNATERMSISSGGNVGINKTSPTARLDVDNTDNSISYPSSFNNSATGYGANATVGTMKCTNTLSRSSSGGTNTPQNEGLNVRVYGSEYWNFGVNSQVDEDNAAAWNFGGYFYADRGTTNKGVVAVGANDNNSSGSASDNFGVDAVGRDASTNYGVRAVASGGTTNYGIYADVGGGTNQWAGYFNGSGTFTGTWTQVSDSMLKNNIQPLNNALAVIGQLNPKTFSYKSQQDLNSDINLPFGIHAGLIAQDLSQVLPELVCTTVHPAKKDETGNEIYPSLTYKSVNYIELIPYLIEAIKEQQAQIDAMSPKAPGPGNSVTGDNNMLRVDLSSTASAVLYQNQPNPFSGITKINYYIPENAGKASMLFYNGMGNVIRELPVEAKGQGTVEVNSEKLSNDVYTYSLVVDGRVIDTRHMVKAK